MKYTSILALVLIVAGPQTETAENIYQALDEAGVKLGAYYGCYESSNDGLVCVLLRQEKKEDEKE